MNARWARSRPRSLGSLYFLGSLSYFMGMKSIVSEKGQVTIPKAIRDRLGLRAGTVLDFRSEQGALVGVKELNEDVFKKWRGRGKLAGKRSVDDYLSTVRGG